MGGAVEVCWRLWVLPPRAPLRERWAGPEVDDGVAGVVVVGEGATAVVLAAGVLRPLSPGAILLRGLRCE